MLKDKLIKLKYTHGNRFNYTMDLGTIRKFADIKFEIESPSRCNDGRYLKPFFNIRFSESEDYDSELKEQTLVEDCDLIQLERFYIFLKSVFDPINKI
jgi:hypothetical protein